MKTRPMFLKVAILFNMLILGLNGSEVASDVVVVLPPELNNTPSMPNTNQYQRSKEDEIRLKLRNKIPSVPEGYILRTLGQLTKQSDSIIIGTVKKIIRKPKTVDRDTDTAYEFKVNVVTNLYGDARKKTFNLKYSNEPLGSGVRVNDCVLLFLSHGEPSFDPDVLRFSYKKPAIEKNNELLILGGIRGVEKLQIPYHQDDVYKAATNYISILRCEKRDPKKYYSFLKNVTKTQNQRLIEDGNSDLMFLFNTCREIDFYEIVNDEELDSRIRDYIRLVIIPHKEKKLKQEAEQ